MIRNHFFRLAITAIALFLLAGSTFADHPSKEDSSKLKILILGGTGFIGPWEIQAALAHGHEITLFNRGKSKPDLYPELERLQQNRHAMAHLRREHEEIFEIIDQMKEYKGQVEAGTLKPTQALEMRRLCIRFYALVKTHVGEEEEYLRVLQGNLSEGEQATVEKGLEHTSAE